MTPDKLRATVRIGTSGWSYGDWVGPFYREGALAQDYLTLYAEHFDTVEVDATFYRIPARATVEGWARRTPESFRFAPKVPSTITHGAAGERPRVDRVLADSEGHLETFLEALEPLGERVAVLVFQFPYFRVREMEAADFSERLQGTLERLGARRRAAVEIRNKTWITPEYLALLEQHRAAAVMVDHPYMPPPWKQLELGMVTADLAYVRLLGDRHGIERKTTRWGEIVEDRSERISRWAQVIRQIASSPGVTRVYAFSNNHFAGHAPATCRELERHVFSGTESGPGGGG